MSRFPLMYAVTTKLSPVSSKIPYIFQMTDRQATAVSVKRDRVLLRNYNPRENVFNFIHVLSVVFFFGYFISKKIKFFSMNESNKKVYVATLPSPAFGVFGDENKY